jgi:WD40 repeat protein
VAAVWSQQTVSGAVPDALLSKLLDVAPMQETAELKGHTRAVLAVAFCPDGRRLASGGADGTIKLWTVNGAGDPITCKNPGGMRGPVCAVTFAHLNFVGHPSFVLAAAGGRPGACRRG